MILCDIRAAAASPLYQDFANPHAMMRQIARHGGVTVAEKCPGRDPGE